MVKVTKDKSGRESGRLFLYSFFIILSKTTYNAKKHGQEIET